MSVTGIVLAGGRSTRFGGRPKLAAELDGVSILARTIGSISDLAAEVIVAGPWLPHDLAGRPRSLRLVPDVEPFGGPLQALAGALRVARSDRALVIAGDMPRSVPAVLRAMLARLDEDRTIDAVILGTPLAGDRPQPRRQVLPLACRTRAARTSGATALAAGDRSLQSLVDRLARVEIPAGVWLKLDPDASTLFDVDTESDLERARGRES